MDRERPHRRDRGQVGIGTLIVFISMVLVAAIAAGVLINTTGFLQSQSEQTGQESTSQAADRIQVVTAVGSVSNKEVTRINMTVKKAPGAEDVALGNMTVEYVDEDQIVTLAHPDTDLGPGADGSFSMYTLADPDGSINGSKILNEPDDRAIVELDQEGSAFSEQLDEGDSADITITTRSGGKTTVAITVPDSLFQKSSVSL